MQARRARSQEEGKRETMQSIHLSTILQPLLPEVFLALAAIALLMAGTFRG